MIDLHCDDMLDILPLYPDNFFDLVVTSPPYEDARTYNIDFKVKGDDWVEWAVKRYLECVRVCKGLVVWVVEGKTRQFRWSATPALLMVELHRAGVKLRKPPIYHRVGIPGSGGPDWWRNDYEFCIASSKGKLPWSDNTATGKPPKYGPGGALSYRLKDGTRKHNPGRRANGKTEDQTYRAPNLANPGNAVEETYTTNEVAAMLDEPPDVIHCNVGGGRIGSKFAHENEAPFPESLVEPFVKCFCPPGGYVLDPFCGSGTTLAVADRLGRNAVGIDVRQSQIDLTRQRLELDNLYTISD